MEAHSVERKLAAIFAADVEGYSLLMGRDEVGTLRTLTAYRVIVDRLIVSHRGRIFSTAGDSLVADFSSAVDAVQCAVAVQDAIAKENTDPPVGDQMRFRIGIHVGDIIMQGDNLFGDAVNVAARLEALAEPGGICISGALRDQIGTKLPLTFTDLGEQQGKNIAQPIRVYRVRGETSPTVTPVVGSSLPLPDKPSIAVLPFTNMSGDPEQEYFADGMVEEIITALSRIKRLFVIARNSSFTYKGRSVDLKQVSRELGVRYVLEGSVRKAAGRVRITAQLIEAANSSHLWADRFDGSLEDVFELQDKVASNVAGVIEPTLETAEGIRLANRPSTDLNAYELYLRALPDFHSYERARIFRALELFNAAIARDPRYGPALGFAANCHLMIAANGWSEDGNANAQRAVDLARRALQADADDPCVTAPSAMVLAAFGDDIDAAIALIDRALETNPSFAFGWFRSGVIRVFAGHSEIAIRHLETSLRLNPLGRMSTRCRAWLGTAQFFDRQFERALASLLPAQEELPDWLGPRRFLISCYAHLGRLGEAREAANRLQATGAPLVPPETVFRAHRNPDQQELLLSGLRLAGGNTI